MNITNLDKAAVLQALFNASKQQGLGCLDPAGKEQMSLQHARAHIDYENNPDLYFDYLHGRVMKVGLAKDEVNTRAYNRDNGPDAAEAAIRHLQAPVTG